MDDTPLVSYDSLALSEAYKRAGFWNNSKRGCRHEAIGTYCHRSLQTGRRWGVLERGRLCCYR